MIHNLIGKEIRSIDGAKPGSEEVRITTTDGGYLLMHHLQDCCESVSVEEVIGDPADLIGGTVSVAEERSSDGESDYGSSTWTFYEIRTTKGDLTIRWFGESNGYYSESVDLEWRTQ